MRCVARVAAYHQDHGRAPLLLQRAGHGSADRSCFLEDAVGTLFSGAADQVAALRVGDVVVTGTVTAYLVLVLIQAEEAGAARYVTLSAGAAGTLTATQGALCASIARQARRDRCAAVGCLSGDRQPSHRGRNHACWRPCAAPPAPAATVGRREEHGRYATQWGRGLHHSARRRRDGGRRRARRHVGSRLRHCCGLGACGTGAVQLPPPRWGGGGRRLCGVNTDGDGSTWCDSRARARPRRTFWRSREGLLAPAGCWPWGGRACRRTWGGGLRTTVETGKWRVLL